MEKHQLIHAVRAQMRYATGRDYRIDLDAMDTTTLRELIRLLRDLDYDKRSAVNRARIMPWRQ